MTARKSTAPATAGFSFANLTPEISELPKITKARKENPLFLAVETAVENAGVAYKLAGIPAEHAKEAYNMLRRAQKDLDCGLNVRQEDRTDGTVTFHYSAKSKKAQRYTVEDVRAWAETNGIDREHLFPRVKREVSAAYREAHNL